MEKQRIGLKDTEIKKEVYSVFKGIELIYNDIHTGISQHYGKCEKKILQIDHCREGRMERSINQEYFYLEPGDMAVTSMEDTEHITYYPNNHYHGITILIDLDDAPECLSCFLDDVNVQPKRLFEKFCEQRKCFIARSSDSIEHIFSEVYSVQDSIRIGYFKIKVLELLLFLSCIDIEQPEKLSYSPAQVELAKKTSQYIAEHLAERIKIENLTEQFHVSSTKLKNSFKGVYGMSVSAYIRTQKMQAAAYLLKTTDETVLNISSQFGYDNGSKFARAFRDVMGKTPNEYRMDYHKVS